MMYHPIKYGCKKISSSVDMVETVKLGYMSHHCDSEQADSKTIFLQNILAHDDASPHQVWFTKGSAVEKNIRWNSEPFFSLILTTTEQSNLFTRQSSL